MVENLHHSQSHLLINVTTALAYKLGHTRPDFMSKVSPDMFQRKNLHLSKNDQANGLAGRLDFGNL